MRRRVPGCGAVVCAAWVAAVVAHGRAETVIPWQAAGSYEGDVVTVEGDVVRARLEADTCVLEFSPGDEKAFRVVLLIPLMTNLPRQPQRLYEGKRVRASGKVRSWQGRPEMIVRGPDAIEVVGVAAGAPEAAPPATVPPPPVPPRTTVPAQAPTTLAPPSTVPPPTLPPPATAPPATLAPAPTSPPTTHAPRVPATTPPPSTLPPAAPPSTLPAPPATAAPPPPVAAPEQPEEAPRLPQRVDPCDAAHERWRRAAAAADARAAELGRCLRAGGYRCRPAAAAMGPVLTELEWAEQQVEAACP
jgi:hypothetical protein